MHEATPKRRWVFKVVMLGDYAVCKTCIVKRYVTNTFHEDYKASIGVDISSQKLRLGFDEVQLQIWDMSGQTGFSRIRSKHNNACFTACYVIRADSAEFGLPRHIPDL